MRHFFLVAPHRWGKNTYWPTALIPFSAFGRYLWALIAFLLFPLSLQAQQLQGANWFFGEHVGIDFTHGAPRFVDGGQTFEAYSNASSVSDASGKLLFYATTDKLYDRLHREMPSTAQWRQQDRTLATAAATVAIPIPGSATRYYLFRASWRAFMHNSSEPATVPLSYGVIDLALNNGYGDLDTSIGVQDIAQGMMRTLTTLPDRTGAGTWLIAHKMVGNSFYAWHITAAGISQPNISQAGFATDSITGSNDFEDNLSQLKSAGRSSGLLLNFCQRGLVQEFIFSNINGRCSYFTSLPVASQHTQFPADTAVNSVSFSPSGSKIYMIAGPIGFEALYQLSQRVNPDTNAYKVRTKVLSSNPSRYLVAIQNGPDGKTYFTSDTTFQTQPVAQLAGQLNVIDCPEAAGAACGVRMAAVTFPTPRQIAVPPALNEAFFRNADRLQVVATDSSLCVGDSTTLLAFGGGYSQFAWDAAPGLPPGAVGARVRVAALTAGSSQTYQITATGTCGASQSQSVTLSTVAAPSAPILTQRNDTLFSSAPTGNQWLLNGQPISGATGRWWVPAANGTYSVQSTNVAGCSSSSAAIVLGTPANEPGSEPDSELKAWPVPADESLWVALPVGGTQESLTLRDALGRVVLRADLRANANQSGPQRLDTHALPEGIYMLNLQADAHRAWRRVVVQH